MENSDKLPGSRLIIRGDSQKKQIAITFDAGTEGKQTPDILAVLRKHRIQATFFLTGVWAEKYPQLAHEMLSQGHEIGNHSYDHPDMADISYGEMIRTIQRGEEAIEQATGVSPRPLFRQPFGSFSSEILRATGESGYPYSIYWDVDPLDWQQPPVQTIVNRILYKTKEGSIILLHLNGVHTARAADIAIGNLKARGFLFVPIGELLRGLEGRKSVEPAV